MSEYAIDQRRRAPTRVRTLGDAVPLYLTRVEPGQAAAEKTNGQIDKTLAELFAERRDAAELTTRCAVDGCTWPGFTGTAAECREAAAAHRAAAHPELAGVRSRRERGLGSWKRNGQVDEQTLTESRRRRQERDDQQRLETIERGRARAALEEAASARGDVGAVSSSVPLDRLAETEPEPKAAVAAVESLVAAPAIKRTASTPPARTGRAPSGEVSASTTTTGRTRMRRTWTPETMIAEIQALARELGHTPTSSELASRKLSSLITKSFLQTKGFPSYADLCQAAGLSPNRPGVHVARPAALARREPIRTADIPYSADILEDEARFLRQRADALEQLASGIRTLTDHTREQVA